MVGPEPPNHRGQTHHRGQTQHASFRAYLFGPFRVFRGESPLGQRGERRETALILLKWFLLNQGRPCSMDELGELCWPGAVPETAAGSFHVAMHCLRRMLEPELPPRGRSSFIRRSGNNFYRFEADGAWWTDAREVEQLLGKGRANDDRGDKRRACFYYSRVAAYGVRQFLEDDESRNRQLAPYRKQYEGLCSQAMIRLIQLHRACDELDEACEYAHQMLRLDQYNQLAAMAITEAYLRSGRADHARHWLDTFLQGLERDLGAVPHSDLAALRKRLMLQSDLGFEISDHSRIAR